MHYSIIIDIFVYRFFSIVRRKYSFSFLTKKIKIKRTINTNQSELQLQIKMKAREMYFVSYYSAIVGMS
jgi:hypothetical protein